MTNLTNLIRTSKINLATVLHFYDCLPVHHYLLIHIGYHNDIDRRQLPLVTQNLTLFWAPSEHNKVSNVNFVF